MNVKEIFTKMKEDNLRNEINLAKKINDGNENLKNTLYKIKKNMEKLSIYSNVNYDCFSEKSNYKKNNNYHSTQSLDKINDKLIFNKTINPKKNKEEIQIINKPITIFDDDDDSKINNEKEVIHLKKELMDNNEIKINNTIKNNNQRINKNDIKNINKKDKKKDIKKPKIENKIEIENSYLTNHSDIKNNKDQNKSKILTSNSLNINESTLNKTNKSNSKQTEQNNKIQNQKKLKQKTITLKTTFQNQNIYKSPNLLLKTRITKNKINDKNNNITNSTTLQSNSKKKINNSKTINYDNDIIEHNKKTISIDSNKKYYDIDSQNKIILKYNTRRSDKNNLNNIYDKDYNNFGYNYNNNKQNLFLKNNSTGRNFNDYNIINEYKSDNINLYYPKKYTEDIINSIDSNNNYNNNNNFNNYENLINYNNNYHKNHNYYNNDYYNNNYNLPYNEKIRIISSSQNNIIRNKNYNNKFNIDERSDENKESNENSNLYKNKNEKHKKFQSDDYNNKNNNSIIHTRLNYIQKKYVELKNQIDILKKEKDFIKKEINEKEELNNHSIPKIKITKFKSESDLINKKRNKTLNKINSNKTKKIINDIYDDYKEREEKIIKEISKIKDYPEINKNDDKIGIFIDEIIKNGFNKYKNKKCSNCDSLLSKRIFVKKCPNRKHIFQNQLE